MLFPIVPPLTPLYLFQENLPTMLYYKVHTSSMAYEPPVAGRLPHKGGATRPCNVAGKYLKRGKIFLGIIDALWLTGRECLQLYEYVPVIVGRTVASSSESVSKCFFKLKIAPLVAIAINKGSPVKRFSISFVCTGALF